MARPISYDPRMPFTFRPLDPEPVYEIVPRVFEDDRGFFLESYKEAEFVEHGIPRFVQDNHSRSQRGVLRGLHYQLPPHAQGKLVRATVGEVFDVAVDIRRSSPTFGQWIGRHLSAENAAMLYVPEGFAHGFLVLSDWAEVQYKTTSPYAPDAERSIRWDDPELAVDWPTVDGAPHVASKDATAPLFVEADVFS